MRNCLDVHFFVVNAFVGYAPLNSIHIGRRPTFDRFSLSMCVKSDGQTLHSRRQRRQSQP